VNRPAALADFAKPLQPPGGMMIWVFIFMEMKHTHRVWQVSMVLFTLVLFGAISFSL
jgi:hypothetical protein